MDPLEESLIAIQKLRDVSPDKVNAYLSFTNKVKSESAIGEKERALINVALAMHSKCSECISFNVNDAIESQASKDEIIDAALLAVAMGGGSIMMYMKILISELEAFD